MRDKRCRRIFQGCFIRLSVCLGSIQDPGFQDSRFKQEPNFPSFWNLGFELEFVIPTRIHPGNQD
jgi:hypothetical protein